MVQKENLKILSISVLVLLMDINGNIHHFLLFT